MTPARAGTALLAGLAVAALAVPAAWAAKNDTLLVSRAPGARGPGGNLGSFSPSISDDGTLVAFDSGATNLLPDDKDDLSDVFVRNVADATVTLVSTGGDGQSSSPVISADGRYVAFVTFGNQSERADVYVRDLKAHTTTLVSRSSGGVRGDGDSFNAAISADGRYVAFVSDAANLVAQDTDTDDDIYVRDLKTNTTRLVTQSALNVPKNGAPTNSPTISANGRYVAFVTGRKDLLAQTTPSEFGSDVLVRDLQTGRFELVSRASGSSGAPANDDSGHPSLSADGRHVAFHSLATNLAAGGAEAFTDVFVRDRSAGTTALVSVVPGVPQSETAAGESFSDAISSDGRYVTFSSSAAGLVPGGANVNEFGDTFNEVFVRDLKTGTTKLVSRASGAAGAVANDFSSSSVVSRGGRFVAYASNATNLHPDAVAAASVGDDEEPAGDIYARDVLGSDGGGGEERGGRIHSRIGCPLAGHVLTGTAKADVLTGTSRIDLIFGRAGNDLLRGRGGRDCLVGDSGHDRLYGDDAGDWLRGGPGPDRLDGGRGSDRLRGQSGRDWLIGGSGNDSLAGGDDRDRIDGASGDDRLVGGELRDRLAGGTGDDRLIGGTGNDRLRGQRGRDRLSDHRGRDHFSGGPGNDRISARDTTTHGRRFADVVKCGLGAQDLAIVDLVDRVAADCERVVRR